MILVFGATGQVGFHLRKLLGERALSLTRSDLDFLNPEKIPPLLDQLKPKQIFNACAYTDVDGAERDPKAAHRVNAQAPQAIARWCSNHEVPWIHYSTDYVFSGTPNDPNGWLESDTPHPLSVYGKTKLEGEQAILAEKNPKVLILRTSWVYSSIRKNFVTTLLNLAKQGKPISASTDQQGSPTCASNLALASLQALENALGHSHFPSGIYHLCNLGSTTRYEWARTFFDQIQALQPSSLFTPSLEKVLNAEFYKAHPGAAPRPLDCRLNPNKIRSVLGVGMPDWKEGMRKVTQELIG